MFQRLRRYTRQLATIPSLQSDIRAAREELAAVRESIGRVEARQTTSVDSRNLADYEFRVFSQWGEDGIIQYLIRNLKVADKSFIEFGVESYREANTKFLLMHDNWRGLIIDASPENIASAKSEDIYWRYNLTAVCAFITPDAINDLFEKNGFSGPIGLLSVDIDGVDYWVWKSISVVSPAIVIAEYNARFGPDRSVTVPFDPEFSRNTAHYSNIYYGASLAALVRLATSKGYAFIGCNSNGNNAFFVRLDLMPPTWKGLTSREGFVACQFREARARSGELSYLSSAEESSLLDNLLLVEV